MHRYAFVLFLLVGFAPGVLAGDTTGKLSANIRGSELLIFQEMPNQGAVVVARAYLGNAPYPSVSVSTGSVILRTENLHHGVFETIFTFKRHDGAFDLTTIVDYANGDTVYADKATTTLSLYRINMATHTASMWRKIYTTYGSAANSRAKYMAERAASENAQAIYAKTKTFPFPACATVAFRHKAIHLNGFKYDDVTDWYSRLFRQSNCQ